MKTVLKSLLMITTIAFFASCGGSNEQATQEETTTETEATTEATTETASLTAGTYTIVADSTNALKWTGSHIGKSYEHFGKIMLSSGSFTVTDGNITAGALEINMGSISVDDIPVEKEENGKLVGHLSAPDFFDVAQFPSAAFAVKSVAASSGEGTHTITGDLTIKGVTEEISFPVTVSAEGSSVMVNGSMVFDRTKFGVSYSSGSLADVLKENVISDDVKLEFNLTATM